MSLPYAKFIIVISMGAFVIGCASTQKDAPEEIEVVVVEESVSSNEESDTTSTMGIGDTDEYTGDPLDDPDSLLSIRIVYFDFDSSDVRPEDKLVIAAHAEFLSQRPTEQIVLEGHADERGTREYNAALGEERAKAVRSLMSFQGAAGQQIKTVSWGEERPIDRGHDETAWGVNRRVEIIYLNR